MCTGTELGVESVVTRDLAIASSVLTRSVYSSELLRYHENTKTVRESEGKLLGQVSLQHHHL